MTFITLRLSGQPPRYAVLTVLRGRLMGNVRITF